MTEELKKTPLYQNYIDSGAKIVEFSGWAMPVQFSSIKEEHNAVRYEIGLFDVSHMGEIEISGNEAFNLFNISYQTMRTTLQIIKQCILLYVMKKVASLMI